MWKLKELVFPREIVFTYDSPLDRINWLTQERDEKLKLENCKDI